MKRLTLLAACALLCADAAFAQSTPAPAPTQSPRPLTIEDLIASTAASSPVAASTPTPAVSPVATPAPAAAPPAAQPVFIDDWESRARPQPTPKDIAYETSVLSVFQSAQGRQGVLDGRWRVEMAGRPLYTLQFADPGAGESRIEGAWRNLGLSGPASSGLVDEVTRDNDAVVVRFVDVTDLRTEIRLRPTGAGDWTGEAIAGQDRAPIVMVRDQGVEVAASAVPAYTPPPPPPAPKAKPAPVRKKVAAKKSPKPAARSRASAKKK